MGWRRPAAALIAASALLTGGCTVPNVRWAAPRSGQLPSASASSGVRWRPCSTLAQEITGRRASNVTFDCGTVTVPRDWAQPNSPLTFDISVMRARATGQRDRIGSLLVNPGGPGGSGVETAAYLASGLPVAITRRFDVVGFDPRGVGRSAPVKCVSDADLDASFAAEPDPVSQPAFDTAVALARRSAAGCQAKYGDTLRLFSTEQAARDMDAVRAAVGDPTTTYLGYSYGTLLGATYAQLFPTRVRALVLDGAVDPQQDAIAGSESQAKGFERALDNFATWCADNTDRCPIGPDARAAVSGALTSARRTPVRNADGRTATAGWVMTAVVSSLYQQSDWLRLGRALADLRSGDATEVFELADEYADRDSTGHYTNLFDANTAVNCADEASPPSIDRIRGLQASWRSKYPVFGATLAVSLLNCTVWPAAARDPYPTGAAQGSKPILVVGTTGDPATPYEQTASLAKMLGVGRVLTWQGEGHTAYPQTRCITDAVNRYLVELVLPADGQTCPAR